MAVSGVRAGAEHGAGYKEGRTFRTQRYGGRVVALSHNVRVSLCPPSPLPPRGMRPRPDGKLALGWWPAARTNSAK
eukprot:7254790-Prymnesium_polylepis.1